MPHRMFALMRWEYALNGSSKLCLLDDHSCYFFSRVDWFEQRCIYLCSVLKCSYYLFFPTLFWLCFMAGLFYFHYILLCCFLTATNDLERDKEFESKARKERSTKQRGWWRWQRWRRWLLGTILKYFHKNGIMHSYIKVAFHIISLICM